MDSETLKKRRAALGWSQAKLAAQLGVTVTTVARWEQGGVKIPPYLELALERIEQKAKRQR